MSETDAKDLGIEDNDWIEVFNSNGALTARAVVSQRVPAGMTMMSGLPLDLRPITAFTERVSIGGRYTSRLSPKSRIHW
ncbi:molybdopterin dinucleotide binding domain-containing protein [Salmonella enterica]|uniref:molybdopterin dinucleotide binding domain-containing protein n=1 Tax=Salmonella enterica TaxID=28901 RepID=UPI0021D049FB|nr:molybdopterin dinucleotide binding domain-containing protein [Salmonella enterica]